MRMDVPVFSRVLFTAAIVISTAGMRPARLECNYRVENQKPASAYSAEVLSSWMNMQVRLMSNTAASLNGPFVRIFSYSGIVAYFSVAPGIKANSPFFISSGSFNQFPYMPVPDNASSYYWPASTNAALAFINRLMFPTASGALQRSIDSLENKLLAEFRNQASNDDIEKSINFGRDVARRIYEWADADGHKFSSGAYTVPQGPGKWEPTPPNYAKPVTPYWGRIRPMVIGSTEKVDPLPPPDYSEDSSSAFYKMNKEVLDVSENMDASLRELVLFWKDINPGFSAPGHWLSVISQVINKENARLDKAAFVYALSAASLNDAWISSWKSRYEFNLLRPITYIRKVMDQPQWNSFLVTPPHPEYTSGFAALAGAVGGALTVVYGDKYAITDHSYDQLGMRPRKFPSFMAMAKEAGDSKFYGGIHYRVSVEQGLEQGRRVANNIASIIKDKKNLAAH